jgi:hypothetical protein
MLSPFSLVIVAPAIITVLSYDFKRLPSQLVMRVNNSCLPTLPMEW